MSKSRQHQEWNATEGTLGRKYVLAKVYSETGRMQEWDKVNGCFGRRYDLVKKYV